MTWGCGAAYKQLQNGRALYCLPATPPPALVDLSHARAMITILDRIVLPYGFGAQHRRVRDPGKGSALSLGERRFFILRPQDLYSPPDSPPGLLPPAGSQSSTTCHTYWVCFTQISPFGLCFGMLTPCPKLLYSPLRLHRLQHCDWTPIYRQSYGMRPRK